MAVFNLSESNLVAPSSSLFLLEELSGVSGCGDRVSSPSVLRHYNTDTTLNT